MLLIFILEATVMIGVLVAMFFEKDLIKFEDKVLSKARSVLRKVAARW